MTNPLFDALFGRHLGKDTDFIIRPDAPTNGPSNAAVISHGDFLKTAARIAHVYKAAGLVPGDRVAVQVAKSPEALALYAAAVEAGVIFIPLNTAYTIEELRYFIEDSGAGLVICDPKSHVGLAPVAEGLGARIMTLDADGGGSLMDAAAMMPDRFDPVAREKDDLAALLYTSGTTGRSKGAMLTQKNLLSNAETLVREWRFDDRDVLLNALPIFHTHGLFVASNITLLAGGSMIFLPGFDLDAMLAMMPRATTMMGVPTFYTRMLGDSRFDGTITAHMRLFVSGSAPLLAETHEAFTQRTGHHILERYGMTETNMNTSNPYDGERRPGTVGFPLPGIAIRITDPETGASLPQGEIGLVEIKGDNVFSGYWKMPEKTREEFRDDGFFISGDLGRIDDDGYLWIVGRDKDLIISGGYNIYPKEIEAVIDDQPAVEESAVIGVPHADFGETPVAVVVLRQGGGDGGNEGDAIDLEMIRAEIEAAIAANLARFKHPREIVFVDALPRNSMGKVQKNILRDAYKSGD